MRWFVACLALVVGAGSGSNLFAQGEFAELVSRVPSSANTLVLIDTDKILATTVAKNEDWKSKLAQAHAAGLTILPPDSNRGVFASHMDLALMAPSWETVVLNLDHDPDVAAFAKRTGGKVEKLDNLPVIDLPGKAYAVQFGKRTVGAMSPATRQVAGRWIAEVKGRTQPALSTYLTSAYKYANNLGTPIIMAIDLENVATPDEVRALLNTNDKYKALPAAQLDKLAEFVAGIQGLTLGVTFGDRIFGKVKVDFATKVPFAPEQAKEALLHALAKRGAMLDELNGWKPAVEGNQISLEGDFTSSGLRRLFSLVSPAPSFKQPPATVMPNTPEESLRREASRTYTKSVNTYLRDLYGEKRDASTMGAIAMWYEIYARKLDQLPTLNVDPELKQFGAYAADQMRYACSALRGAGIAIPAKEAQVAPVYDYYTHTNVYGYVSNTNDYGNGYTGPVGTTNTYAVENRREEDRQKRAIRYEEKGAAFKAANEAMQQVDMQFANVRQKLTAKYKVNF